MPCQKIISGGQTGVDRGALDAALKMQFPCGGWCPEGRTAEDGKIPARYPLQEIKGGVYSDRTKKNVEDSDGTLIIYPKKLIGGSLLTYRHAISTRKPVFLFNTFDPDDLQVLNQIIAEVKKKNVKILNIAGPRASEWNEAYTTSLKITFKLIRDFK